ncbi:serine protease FAM111A-like [Paramisgurnus dabryanus]|uniref:serine protease FAM111A-like n=1 Tax=Paramisgurnus dabryanus TaxID=90735 RepID=UPI0031F35D8C
MSKDIKTEDVPQASSSNQERTDTFPKKEVEEGPAKDLQQEAEEKTFQFCLKKNKYVVTCDDSMTVLDALNTIQIFKNEKVKNRDKAVLIKRSKENLEAAVKTDFPCCLIENNEIINVTFIKNDGDASEQQNITERGQHPSRSNPDMFVTFYIEKRGGEKVNLLLKSEALRGKVECVCVYAHKEDTLKKALKRDGRFIDDIFMKHCGLFENITECRHEMSHPVKHLNQKKFKVVVLSNAIQPDSQDDLTSQVKTVPDEALDAQVGEDVGTSQNPVNTEQEIKQNKNEGESTGASAKPPAPKVIPNSEEILGILRDQFKGLLEKLQERENLKNKSEVQKFFKEEFAKSVENFLKVRQVKRLAKLSDSVCQILVESNPEGTGFLLFGRFILTNAHVIEPFASCTQNQPYLFRLRKEVRAVFNFEEHHPKIPLDVEVNNIVAYALGKNSEDRHLDYALLEMNNDPPTDLPKLLDCHSFAPPRAGSQICIVGHPGEGVKKVDPCFIIEKEPTGFFQVITQQCLKEVEENQIPYHTCFFNGSSGSPVFDEHCYLIGIHTGGFNHKDIFGKKQRVLEYAYSLKPILENIKIQVENMENMEESKRNYILKILEDRSDISDM